MGNPKLIVRICSLLLIILLAIPCLSESVSSSAAPAAVAEAGPDYESREAIPIAPRRFDESDELSKVVFTSESGRDPEEGLGTDNKKTMVAAQPPAKPGKNGPAKNGKDKTAKMAKRNMAKSKVAKRNPSKKNIKLAARRPVKSKGKAMKVARLLPTKKRVPASQAKGP